MKVIKQKNLLILIVIIVSTLFSLVICTFQFIHNRDFKPIKLSDYETIEALYDIETITWINTDYDVISGWVIRKTDPIEPNYRWNTQIVFYQDGSDTAYTLPLKLVKRDDIPTTINAEGVYNAENCGFTGLVFRRSGLRNMSKIGFLIDVSGDLKLVKTNIDYKYIDN